MKNVNIHSLKKILIKIMFLSVLFESICLKKIESFSITLTFFLTTILLFICIIEKIQEKLELKKTLFVLFSIIYFLLISFFSKYTFNESSLFLYTYYLIFFLFVSNTLENEEMNSLIKTFIKLVCLFSIYAIYQFCVYNLWNFLPLKELIPSNILTPNYNTFSNILVGNKYFFRAHSIYLEPSFLSQFSAIAILLTYYCEIKNKKLIYIINIISMIMSLSGTGFIILIFGLFYILIMQKNYKLFIIINLLIIMCFAFIYINKDTNMDFAKYYINRMNELDFENKGSSGYYRFILPIKATGDVLRNDIFGVGAGNDIILANKYGSNESGIPNGYGKMFVEFGIFGIVFFIVIFKMLAPNKNDSNINKILFIIIIAYCFTGGSFVQNSFWCLAILNLRDGRRINESFNYMQ